MEIDWTVYDELQDIGVAHVATDKTIVRCNDAFARQFDQDAIHLAGVSVLDLTSPEDRPRARANFEALVSGSKKSIRHSKRYMKASGGSFERMLQTVVIQGGLLSFVYEYDTGDKDRRLQQYETLLTEVLTVMGGKVSVNVTQSNSQNQEANPTIRVGDDVTTTTRTDNITPGKPQPKGCGTIVLAVVGWLFVTIAVPLVTSENFRAWLIEFWVSGPGVP